MIARTADGYRHQSASATSAGLGVVLGTIHALAERAGWAFWRWYQVRQTTKQLAVLSDHMLTDIGLSRSSLIAATMRRVHEQEASRRGGYG